MCRFSCALGAGVMFMALGCAARGGVGGRASRPHGRGGRARCVCAPLSCVGFSSDRSISVRVARDCDRAVMSIVFFACEVLRCRSLQYRPPRRLAASSSSLFFLLSSPATRRAKGHETERTRVCALCARCNIGRRTWGFTSLLIFAKPWSIVSLPAAGIRRGNTSWDQFPSIQGACLRGIVMY